MQGASDTFSRIGRGFGWTLALLVIGAYLLICALVFLVGAIGVAWGLVQIVHAARGLGGNPLSGLVAMLAGSSFVYGVVHFMFKGPNAS